MSSFRTLVARGIQGVRTRRRDRQQNCIANLAELLLPGEHLVVAVPVMTGGRSPFFGCAGLTAERFVLLLTDHTRRHRPFETIDGSGFITCPRDLVTVRGAWLAKGHPHDVVTLRIPGRSLYLRAWGESLRPLVNAIPRTRPRRRSPFGTGTLPWRRP